MEPTSSTIETDLECARCGYNLRSLSCEAVCPECRCPVSFSRLPGGFSFPSASAIRSVRRGLVLYVLAMLLKALARIEFTAFLRYSLPLKLSRELGRAARLTWGYGYLLSDLALFLAICFASGLLASTGPRDHRRFAWAIALLAFVGIVPRLVDVAMPWVDRWSPHDAVSLFGSITVTAMSIGPPMALLMLFGYLRKQVSSILRPRLRRLLSLAVIAQALIFAGTFGMMLAGILHAVIWRYNANPPLFRGMAISHDSVWYWWLCLSEDVWELADFCEHYLGDACRIVIVLVSWLLLRSLPVYKR